MGVPAVTSTLPDSSRPGPSARVGLVVSNLVVRYGSTVVVEGVSIAIENGKSCALVGPSGSGKSSVLDAVAGIRRVDEGTVDLGPVRLSGLTTRGAAEFRSRHIGLVSQAPELLDELTVLENVALPLRLEGCAAKTSRATAEAVLERVGLADLTGRRIDQISGGQAQRVAIARALCRTDLRLVVADEPTAALDQQTARDVTSLLLREAERVGAATLVATHDPMVVAACDAEVHLVEPLR